MLTPGEASKGGKASQCEFGQLQGTSVPQGIECACLAQNYHTVLTEKVLQKCSLARESARRELGGWLSNSVRKSSEN